MCETVAIAACVRVRVIRAGREAVNLLVVLESENAPAGNSRRHSAVGRVARFHPAVGAA